ncbi:MAG: FixH family protein [Melioribacteraceae bacterium]|nr:FixH family protein [Melioribacteraceae bacterium]
METGKMKFSWGVGISITIIVFLIGSLATVYFTTTVDYDLVAEDYYEKELVYQEQIDKMNRANALTQQLVIKLEGDNIQFKFPSIFNNSEIEGEIYFYKPSSEDLDVRAAISLDEENSLYFSQADLSKGLWKIKVEWGVRGVEYYTEKIIMVP